MDSSWATLTIIGAVLLSTILIGIPATRRNKTKPVGGMSGALGVMDEIFHPTAHEASIIMEAQNEAGSPNPSPEDKPFDGKITINVRS